MRKTEKARRERFFIIGGDLRQIACAKALREKGFEVILYGFSDEYTENFDLSEKPEYDMENADFILLPLPVTYDGININTPLYNEKVPLKFVYDNIKKEKTVFGGLIKEEFKNCCISSAIYDYAKDEEFLIKNAMITAEGAFDIIFSEIPISVFGSNFLITGYGRIGKIMAQLAKTFGAETYVAARKTADLTWIEINGHKALKYRDLKDEIGKFDIIVNTVPVRIFDEKIIENISRNALFIDLASMPGGCDIKDMQKVGVKAIHALSLPGKTSPYSSGRIISDTILNMIDKE